MTPAEALAELRRRGAHVEVLADGALRISPRSALDDQLRAVLGAHKGEVALLVTDDPPPDRTPLPATCPVCSGVIFWRAFGSPDLVCNRCRPCPTPTAALWYAAEIPGDPLAEIYDPDTRADLAWLARRRPAVVSELLTLERRCDALVGAPDGRAFEDACRTLVETVRRLCRESRLMQQRPN